MHKHREQMCVSRCLGALEIEFSMLTGLLKELREHSDLQKGLEHKSCEERLHSLESLYCIPTV